MCTVVSTGEDFINQRLPPAKISLSSIECKHTNRTTASLKAESAKSELVSFIYVKRQSTELPHRRQLMTILQGQVQMLEQSICSEYVFL